METRTHTPCSTALTCVVCLFVVFVTRTIMGPYGANRAVQRLEFRDCRKGLGEF